MIDFSTVTRSEAGGSSGLDPAASSASPTPKTLGPQGPHKNTAFAKQLADEGSKATDDGPRLRAVRSDDAGEEGDEADEGDRPDPTLGAALTLSAMNLSPPAAPPPAALAPALATPAAGAASGIEAFPEGPLPGARFRGVESPPGAPFGAPARTPSEIGAEDADARAPESRSNAAGGGGDPAAAAETALTEAGPPVRSALSSVLRSTPDAPSVRPAPAVTAKGGPAAPSFSQAAASLPVPSTPAAASTAPGAAAPSVLAPPGPVRSLTSATPSRAPDRSSSVAAAPPPRGASEGSPLGPESSAAASNASPASGDPPPRGNASGAAAGTPATAAASVNTTAAVAASGNSSTPGERLGTARERGARAAGRSVGAGSDRGEPREAPSEIAPMPLDLRSVVARDAGTFDGAASATAKTMTNVNGSPAAGGARAGDDARPTSRDAVASAVNQLTIRHATGGSIDLPELGRVSVHARLDGGRVDVEVHADRGETARTLATHASAIASEVRSAAVPLGRLSFEGASGPRTGAETAFQNGGEPPRGGHAGRGGNDGDLAVDGLTPATASTGGPARRVRIVL